MRTKVCSKCGAETTLKSKECFNCGAALTISEKINRGVNFIKTLVGVTVLIVVFGYFVLLNLYR